MAFLELNSLTLGNFNKRRAKTFLRDIMNKANKDHIQEGLYWYFEANKIAKGLTENYDINLAQAAGILSAFSPSMGWEQNVINASAFVRDCFIYGFDFWLDDLNKPLTERTFRYTQSDINLLKAFYIIKLENPSFEQVLHYFDYTVNGNISKGFKTRSFFINIFNPLSDTATLDRHALSACVLHPKLKKSKAYSIKNKKLYELFEQVYREIAQENNITIAQTQAIIWVYWRDKVLGRAERYDLKPLQAA